jgi:F-type H+-transporting ATPase subunit a
LFQVVFLFLEVLFGTIQALVFALLTLIYIVLATAGHHDEDEEHAPHAEPVPVQPVASGAAGD